MYLQLLWFVIIKCYIIVCVSWKKCMTIAHQLHRKPYSLPVYTKQRSPPCTTRFGIKMAYRWGDRDGHLCGVALMSSKLVIYDTAAGLSVYPVQKLSTKSTLISGNSSILRPLTSTVTCRPKYPYLTLLWMTWSQYQYQSLASSRYRP